MEKKSLLLSKDCIVMETNQVYGLPVRKRTSAIYIYILASALHPNVPSPGPLV